MDGADGLFIGLGFFFQENPTKKERVREKERGNRKGVLIMIFQESVCQGGL